MRECRRFRLLEKKESKTYRGIAHDGLMRKSKGQLQSSTCSRIISLSCLSWCMECSSNDPGCRLSQHFVLFNLMCVWFERFSLVERGSAHTVCDLVQYKIEKLRKVLVRRWREGIRETETELGHRHVQLKRGQNQQVRRVVQYLRRMRGMWRFISFFPKNV